MKKINYIIFALLTNFVLVLPQSNTIDSLRDTLSFSKDSLKAEIFNKLSWSYRNTDPVLSIKYSDSALFLALQHNIQRELVKGYSFQGVAYRNMSNSMKALNCYQLFNTGIYTSTKGTNKESGTGIGLSLCIDLANKQGGSIKAKSVPEKGSVFTLFIPKDFPV